MLQNELQNFHRQVENFPSLPAVTELIAEFRLWWSHVPNIWAHLLESKWCQSRALALPWRSDLWFRVSVKRFDCTFSLCELSLDDQQVLSTSACIVTLPLRCLVISGCVCSQIAKNTEASRRNISEKQKLFFQNPENRRLRGLQMKGTILESTCCNYNVVMKLGENSGRNRIAYLTLATLSSVTSPKERELLIRVSDGVSFLRIKNCQYFILLNWAKALLSLEGASSQSAQVWFHRSQILLQTLWKRRSSTTFLSRSWIREESEERLKYSIAYISLQSLQARRSPEITMPKQRQCTDCWYCKASTAPLQREGQGQQEGQVQVWYLSSSWSHSQSVSRDSKVILKPLSSSTNFAHFAVDNLSICQEIHLQFCLSSFIVACTVNKWFSVILNLCSYTAEEIIEQRIYIYNCVYRVNSYSSRDQVDSTESPKFPFFHIIYT